MLLRDLLTATSDRPGLTGLVVGSAAGGTEITGVSLDSRTVGPGTLFACAPGEVADGHDFAAGAVAAGAVALLCERPLGLGVPELVVPSVRLAVGPLVAAFHHDPSGSLAVVGVTGTNGKTTVTHLVQAILSSAGRSCGVIGTLSGARTTPEAPELQAQLAGFVAEGRAAAAIEVSSHALDQHRVDGTRFAVVAFTNLSQDHLDYHGTMEAYFQAKARLFDPALADRAVVCTDEAHGRLLLDAALLPTVGCSLADATDVRITANGTTFTWRGVTCQVALVGRFNLANAIVAATIAAELGLSVEEIAAGLATARPVDGRFELVDAGQPFVVAVDYAHTPDGLVKVLGAARELAGDHRVIVVFGAGGDRDPAKRPLMGEAAAAGADVVIVTSDNPRSEDPHAIIEAVRTGIPDDDNPQGGPTVQIVEDRRAAIAAGISAASAGDVLVIAGKGHETTQLVGATAIPFDDRVVAREELVRAGGGS